MTIILASASPRRAELLRQTGLCFRIEASGMAEETNQKDEPREMVVNLAKQKALVVAERLRAGYVLGADTIVLYRGEIFGKPLNVVDARRMLEALSSSCHEVLTGLYLLDAATGRSEQGVSSTRVWMKALSAGWIDAYIAGGEPMDKAGAYGIQGRAALFVDRIDGCYFNVVGLPLSLLFEMIVAMDIPTWVDGKDECND